MLPPPGLDFGSEEPRRPLGTLPPPAPSRLYAPPGSAGRNGPGPSSSYRAGRTASGRGSKKMTRGRTGERPAPVRPALLYVVDAPATLAQNQVVVTLARRHKRPGTDRGALKPWWHSRAAIAAGRVGPEDLDLLDLLDLARVPPQSGAGESNGLPVGTNKYIIRSDVQSEVVERLCRSGRLPLAAHRGRGRPAATALGRRPALASSGLDIRCADAAGQALDLARHPPRRNRGQDRMDLAEPLVLLPGLVIQGIGRAARFDDAGIFLWMARLAPREGNGLRPSRSRTPCSDGSWPRRASAPTGSSRTCSSKKSTCRPSPA